MVSRVTLGPTPLSPKLPLEGANSLQPFLSSNGGVGLVCACAGGGQSKGRSVGTAPQPHAGWALSPACATRNVFLCPSLRAACPNMLGPLSATARGAGVELWRSGWGAGGHSIVQCTQEQASENGKREKNNQQCQQQMHP